MGLSKRHVPFPELAKPGPWLTHRSVSQNSWMQTRHMRPLSGFCAAREGAPLPGCQHSLRLWLFLHALHIAPTFSPLPPLCHVDGPRISMSVKGFSAAPITPRRKTWNPGNKESETEKYPCGQQGNRHVWKPRLFLLSLCLFGMVLSSFSFIIFVFFSDFWREVVL